MRNTFCTRYRNAKREVVVPEEAISEWATIDAPQEWQTRIRELADAFEHLSPVRQQALTAVVLKGATYEKAATDAGCAIGTIKSRINRAREQMAAEIGSRPALDGKSRHVGNNHASKAGRPKSP
ncbi:MULTISPECIES: sigma factor-like helix-turn-helix DNA-binding protein [unclassified Rhizobium]|uniref:sigma factor-like helix-turn-helix DNA-binding protein n=1 Tax=unclassified Rhizobium TaxID=2613769 RepID=UPI001FEE7956|nr:MULTISPECIES: sigma factor-like helix-turn-helix DNA-binding protein [unclassified Rhizobium]